MTSYKKFVMCLGLAAVLAMPLAGCSGTWQGIKNDWHDVTGSNDDVPAETASQQAAPPAEQPAQQQDIAPAAGEDNGPSAYN